MEKQAIDRTGNASVTSSADTVLEYDPTKETSEECGRRETYGEPDANAVDVNGNNNIRLTYVLLLIEID